MPNRAVMAKAALLRFFGPLYTQVNSPARQTRYSTMENMKGISIFHRFFSRAGMAKESVLRDVFRMTPMVS